MPVAAAIGQDSQIQIQIQIKIQIHHNEFYIDCMMRTKHLLQLNLGTICGKTFFVNRIGKRR